MKLTGFARAFSGRGDAVMLVLGDLFWGAPKAHQAPDGEAFSSSASALLRYRNRRRRRYPACLFHDRA